jgi:hypothetical protein
LVIGRAIAAVAMSGAIALAGCGSDDDQAEIPGGADPDAVGVIKDWADELRSGDVEAATDRFGIPSVVQNGTPPLHLTDRDQVKAFNESLPCGAELTEAVSAGNYTIATFKLTERPGPGECGSGVGETAKTAFVIHEGHITQWRRVVDEEPAAPTGTGPIV